MLPDKKEDEVVLSNKQLVQGLCAQDGVLVSPIDLALSSTRRLHLDPLRWVNFDVPPFRMKLTNSGDTMVISAKWAKERPYLCGGPLDGNYVFSQIHFHWGASEHEGSEHTVRGICYPMEMHVVFFKTRYLTQAAALKQDDGIVIVAYLFRLQARSSPGLHWLASQLESVTEPRTSSLVPPMPLATVLVPFETDYISYWGALVSQNCRHPVMWLLSRAALAVSSEDLNLFRSLMNSKKEKMTKNFRSTSPAGGRVVFHVNPSSETNNLLLPGAVDPPCQAVIVNYSHLPPTHQTEAKKIFDKGDSNELEGKDSRGKKPKEGNLKSKLRFNSEQCTPHKVIGDANSHQLLAGVTNSETASITHPSSPNSEKSIDKKIKHGTKLQRQCTLTKKPVVKESGRKPSIPAAQEKKGEGVKSKLSNSNLPAPGKPKKEVKQPVNRNANTITKKNENEANVESKVNNEIKTNSENKANNEKEPQKSKLPVPIANNRKGRKGLESRYARYFKRPESAPIDQATPKSQASTPRPSTRGGGN